ncbi:MAG TPA: cyanophycin synthetase [Candidatus Sulfotelmatobacter sp.]|jgi:UDP-N-acetylmuramoyl-tripeptide--D-alanyl-D-alanine ligase|nr:cyanophycin synthetase [Candidatus Sulfotelmatobacter sp.]
MLEEFKKIFFFPIASYFSFFAAIRLHRWHPKIVVVTGSSGKTTLLHLLESQIGKIAKYSHHANSSFGIPFDILELHRTSLQPSEWVSLICSAPFAAFKNSPKEKIYIVEADCDRPAEGKFLASLLKPQIVLWLNSFRTHSMHFDFLVANKSFTSVDEAIAYEYGFFLEYCTDYAIINGDLPLEKKQKTRTKAHIVEITKEEFLKQYIIDQEKTMYTIKEQQFSFNALLPEEIFYSIAMCQEVLKQLSLPFDRSFAQFNLPPGRSTFFKGIKNTILIDSSYNANLSSTKALLTMVKKLPAKTKWVVIGDMLELGEKEKEEHELLAELLAKTHVAKIILFGPRTVTYTAQKLQRLAVDSETIVTFQSLRELDTYIHDHLNGGETILFKGSQSMLLEGIIERLLKNKDDAQYLPRREKIWVERRSKLFRG